MKHVNRGEIYYANLSPVIGSEQGDTRPVLVVQNIDKTLAVSIGLEVFI